MTIKTKYKTMNTEENNTQLPQSSVITGALISLNNFLSNHLETGCAVKQINKFRKYSELLKEPITLGMFVPTDKNGKVLKGKPLSPNTDAEWIRWENEQEEFYKAKELVLFANFEVKTKTSFNNGYDFICDNKETFYPFWYNPVIGWELSKGLKTVEDLVIFQPKLTDNVLSEYFS